MPRKLLRQAQPALRIALDSGAYSLYTSFSSPKDNEGEKLATKFDRRYANYEYFEGQDFKKYLEKYIAYLHERKEQYDFYVTVDVIFNPDKTWEVLKYIESCGLKPMPVFHVGERLEVLKKLMNDYEYIGVGGLGQEITKQKYIPFADSVFRTICDSKGRPRHRIHGFAISASEILARYPFFSTDATSALLCSRMGGLMVPRPVFKSGKLVSYDYTQSYMHLAMTDRRSHFNWHMSGLTETFKMATQKYIKEVAQADLERLRDSYMERDAANLVYISNMVDQIENLWTERLGKKHELRYYVSGKPNGSMVEFSNESLPKIAARTGGTLRFSYLGTFFALSPTEALLHHLRTLPVHSIRGARN